MRLALLSAVLLCGLPGVAWTSAPAPSPEPPERRCGWFVNPTPANAWLIDRDGEWTIGVQGGHQAEGDWPVFSDRQWVLRNAASYGYGCACMRLTHARGSREVQRISQARARPLSACRTDRAIRDKEPG